jgi:hypothetical protein
MIIDFLPIVGSPTINSIEMLVHICVGIGSGCNALSILTSRPFFHLHFSQVVNKSWIFIFMPLQKNEFLSLS